MNARPPRISGSASLCMVLDEVHAQNWRDVYRAPNSVVGVGVRIDV